MSSDFPHATSYADIGARRDNDSVVLIVHVESGHAKYSIPARASYEFRLAPGLAEDLRD